ncbi:hypothetical protein ABC974_25995 [Sphingomonas oligophenolica]|uniref:Uncharacterized protein n=1 Tax=Sphingomonas oligophenolica TaxID=301154 RepID=A0ABU9YBC6_9SPHN
MSRRGLRNWVESTGTGLAQPNTGRCAIARPSGTRSVPTGSIWVIGLTESRPSLFAVGSPSALATQPCDISCSTMAMTSGMIQIAAA